ncbi:UDP-2,3-diacetamido-2,3-dideoxy-D-mannuronic acid transferase [plant metagenome]|uniref:UDP-2,3-diacetamido-2,3-dideoxy-D-mannuronic acid transferase n=1 Tax=plant metagenome TaxID=1297885 RepID=A0A484Q737_9ZZZZ
MRILIVSQYFWPESFIINDLAREWAHAGHHVEVLTGKPNYPDGKVYAGYTEEGCSSEEFDHGITVHRVPLRPRKAGRAKDLSLNYLSFVWNGIRHGNKLVGKGRFDVVLVFAMSPITAALPAIWLKRKLRSHLAVWIQDLWPESLSATGFVRNRFLLGMVGVMIRFIYAGADTLLVQSHAFREPVARYTRRDKISYYPNCFADTEAMPLVDATVPEGVLAKVESKFSIVFAGNLGMVQALDTIVAAAEFLRDVPNCQFVIAGGGSRAVWLATQVRERKLDNVLLTGRLPVSDMPHIFKRAGALLVTLKREEIFAYTVPSKLQAYLAAGRPVIAALDGEGARVVEEAAAGLTCPAEDARGLADRILEMLEMSPQARQAMGEAGRAYFLRNFELKKQARSLIDFFEAKIGKQGSE